MNPRRLLYIAALSAVAAAHALCAALAPDWVCIPAIGVGVVVLAWAMVRGK